MYSVLIEYYDFQKEDKKTLYYKKKLTSLMSQKLIQKVLSPLINRKSKLSEHRLSVEIKIEKELQDKIRNIKLRDDIKDRIIGTHIKLQTKSIENRSD